MTSKVPEAKVIAGGAGFAIGTQISDAILWCLGVWVWGAPSSGPQSDTAGAAVPLPWHALIVALVPLILGLVAAYFAPHTHRPDLQPVETLLVPAAGGRVRMPNSRGTQGIAPSGIADTAEIPSASLRPVDTPDP